MSLKKHDLKPKERKTAYNNGLAKEGLTCFVWTLVLKIPPFAKRQLSECVNTSSPNQLTKKQLSQFRIASLHSFKERLFLRSQSLELKKLKALKYSI